MSESDTVIIGKMILKLNDLRGKIKDNQNRDVSEIIKGLNDYINEEVDACNAVIESSASKNGSVSLNYSAPEV